MSYESARETAYSEGWGEAFDSSAGPETQTGGSDTTSGTPPAPGTPPEDPARGVGDPAALIVRRVQMGQISPEEGYAQLAALFNNAATAWDYLGSYGIRPNLTAPTGAPSGISSAQQQQSRGGRTTSAEAAVGPIQTAIAGRAAQNAQNEPLGPTFRPFSETERERAQGFRGFLANRFEAGTPGFLQNVLGRQFDPLEVGYEFQRGLGQIPATTDFSSFLRNRPGNIDFGDLANRGANLFSGAPLSDPDRLFQDYLSQNQDRQFALALQSSMRGIPGFLQNSAERIGQREFDKWFTGLPQDEAGIAAAGPRRLNFLPEYQRRGFRF